MNRIVLTLLLMLSLGFACPAFALFGKKKPQKLDDVKDDRKVLIVEIYAKWCPLCRNIQPTLDLLVKEIPDISLIQLDVSNKETAEQSLELATKLGIESYYLANKNKTGSVGILVGSTREVVDILHNSNDIDEYKIAIQEAKTLEKNLENKSKDG